MITVTEWTISSFQASLFASLCCDYHICSDQDLHIRLSANWQQEGVHNSPHIAMNGNELAVGKHWVNFLSDHHLNSFDQHISL